MRGREQIHRKEFRPTVTSRDKFGGDDEDSDGDYPLEESKQFRVYGVEVPENGPFQEVVSTRARMARSQFLYPMDLLH